MKIVIDVQGDLGQLGDLETQSVFNEVIDNLSELTFADHGVDWLLTVDDRGVTKTHHDDVIAVVVKTQYVVVEIMQEERDVERVVGTFATQDDAEVFAGKLYDVQEANGGSAYTYDVSVVQPQSTIDWDVEAAHWHE